MAWSPVRRVNAGILRVKHPGDYVTRNSNNPCDGTLGSCAEYLRNTVSHLQARGIHDCTLWRLQELVAAKIASS